MFVYRRDLFWFRIQPKTFKQCCDYGMIYSASSPQIQKFLDPGLVPIPVASEDLIWKNEEGVNSA